MSYESRRFMSGGSLRMLMAVAALSCSVLENANGWVETPLASYEVGETDLVVTAGSGDTGLMVSRVLGGVSGAPPASAGDYVLKGQFVGEDGKIEFRHEWSVGSYDLLGEDELLADVFIGTYSAVPGLIGIWSANWDPPDAWRLGQGTPDAPGAWVTVSFDVSDYQQTGLTNIHAFVLENLAGANGVVYIDNLRLRHGEPAEPPTGLVADGHEEEVNLDWDDVAAGGLEGYHVYRASALEGPYGRLTFSPVTTSDYADSTVVSGQTYFYCVSSVVDGVESGLSAVVEATAAMSDEELMTAVQEATFRFFWDYGHPVSGLARDGYTGWSDYCVSGGTGMGLMAIVVGVERGFVTRDQAALRVQKIVTFLEESAERYHGAWAHAINGASGATLPFSEKDDGADLVETAYVVQGLLTVRKFFDDPTDPVESDIRVRSTRLWHEVEWDWFRRYPGSDVLYWHWSPNYGWDMNMQVRGFDETMITYLLAIASPTHPMPASAFYNGWAGSGSYANGNTYHGYVQWVGPAWGGPLFFVHYSFLGFDPRNKSDAFCNYYENNRNISLIHQAHCVENVAGYAGYGELSWGLTASCSPPPWYYSAHSPTNDNGTISPTAALSSIAYTPEESLATMRHFYYDFDGDLWGPYGFYDAYNVTEDWVSDNYLAIDQGPIIIMIENYRTQLCWHLFMMNEEIKPMLQAIGWTLPDVDGDFNGDGEVDWYDLSIFTTCMTGPAPETLPEGCSVPQLLAADFDNDNDVDVNDFSVFQTLFGSE